MLKTDFKVYTPIEGRWAETAKWEKLAKHTRDQLQRMVDNGAGILQPDIERLLTDVSFHINDIEMLRKVD